MRLTYPTLIVVAALCAAVCTVLRPGISEIAIVVAALFGLLYLARAQNTNKRSIQTDVD